MRFAITTWTHALLQRPTRRMYTWPQLVQQLTEPPIWHCSWPRCESPVVRRVRCRVRAGESWRTVHLCAEHDQNFDHKVRTGGGAVCGLPTKRQVPLWAPGEWSGGPPAPRSFSAVVLDVEDGTSIDVVQGRWADWAHIVHTTWKHQPDAPRFRVVVPLRAPVSAAWWPRIWRWVLDREPAQDTSCSDVTRQFFAPSRPGADWPWEARVHGDPTRLLHLDDDTLPPPPPPEPKPTPPPRLVRSYGREDREARRVGQARLNSDPEARRRAGIALGGVVSNNNVRKVPCPKCGRASVWWPLQPRASGVWRCAHDGDSCGAYGWLDELLDAVEYA